MPGRELRNTTDDAGLLVDGALVGLARPRDGGQAEGGEVNPSVGVINTGKHAHVAGHGSLLRWAERARFLIVEGRRCSIGTAIKV